MFNSSDSFTGSAAARAHATKMGIPTEEYKTVKHNKIPRFNEEETLTSKLPW
jgi:hypothetical protein